MFYCIVYFILHIACDWATLKVGEKQENWIGTGSEKASDIGRVSQTDGGISQLTSRTRDGETQRDRESDIER